MKATELEISVWIAETLIHDVPAVSQLYYERTLLQTRNMETDW